MWNNEKTVGYKKPPQDKQFLPGKSGNPKGRPKTKSSVLTDLADLLKERVSVTENGQTKKISKRSLLLKQVFTRAVSGDATSLKMIFSLYQKLPESALTARESNEEILTPEDEALLAHYLQSKDKS